MSRPNEDSLHKARRTLRSLVSDGPSNLPSLNLVADSIRVELERRGAVAILYVSLDRYGRLEPIFGWHVVADILDAVAGSLSVMVGQHPAAAGRRQRLHAHRRRLHRPALTAAGARRR